MTRQVASSAPWFYSASQLRTADLCLRKWAWEQIEGIREPPGAAARFGQNVHSVLERWLKNGQALDQFSKEGQVAFEGIPWLPPPGPELEVERKFHIQVGDFFYRGFVDLGFLNSDGVPWVVDHKTTRDFMWQLSIDDLMNDIQGLLYAKEALDRYQVDVVHLRWVYYLTTKPYRSRVTECHMTRDDIDRRWGVIDDLARETDKVRLTVVNPLDLPPNAKACAAYGGCPHQQRCNLTPREIRKSIMAQNEKKTLLERMKNRAQTRGASTPAAKPTPSAKQTNAKRNMSVVPDPAPTAASTQTKKSKEQSDYEKFLAWQRSQEGGEEVPEETAAEPKVNPPEQPEREVQLSSELNEERQGRTTTRASEGEATATAPKTTTRKPRTTKPKGFVIDDQRTANLLLICAAVMSGNMSADDGIALIGGEFSDD